MHYIQCELRRICATLFLSWEDSRLLESATLQAFEVVLSSLSLFKVESTEKQLALYSNTLRGLHSRKLNPLFL